MATIRWRNNPAHLLIRRILLVALLAVIVWAILGVWQTYQKEQESASLRMRAENQLADLALREKQLQTSIAKLGTTRGVEEVLRQEYAIAGKGEGLIVIVDEPPPASTTATSSFLGGWLHKAFPWW
jgi:cell division protein FtsB